LVVPLDAMPMLPSGKIDLEALMFRARYELDRSQVKVVDSLGIVRTVSREAAHLQRAVECCSGWGIMATILHHWTKCDRLCDAVVGASISVQYFLRYVLDADFLLLLVVVGGAFLDRTQTKRLAFGKRELMCMSLFLFMGWPLCKLSFSVMPWPEQGPDNFPFSIHRWFLAMFIVARACLVLGQHLFTSAEQVSLLGLTLVLASSDLVPGRPFMPSCMAYSLGLVESYRCVDPASDDKGFASFWDRKFLSMVFIYLCTFHYGKKVSLKLSAWVSHPAELPIAAALLYICILVFEPYMMGIGDYGSTIFQLIIDLLLGCAMSALVLACFWHWQPSVLRWFGRHALASFVLHGCIPVRGMPWDPRHVLPWLGRLHHSEFVTAPLQLVAVLSYPAGCTAIAVAILHGLRAAVSLARAQCSADPLRAKRGSRA